MKKAKITDKSLKEQQPRRRETRIARLLETRVELD